jgi:hypothetical protein
MIITDVNYSEIGSRWYRDPSLFMQENIPGQSADARWYRDPSLVFLPKMQSSEHGIFN